jgi:hypothetical protein
VCRPKRSAMDTSIVEVERTRKDVRACRVDSINFDVPMVIAASTLHSSAITKMIAAIIPMKLLAVS